MSYRETYTITIFIQISFILFMVCLPITLLNGYSPFIDSLLRVHINSCFIETYYFWWTNLTYLPFFFFSLSILLFTYRFSRSSIIILFFFTLYLTEFIEYTVLSLNEPNLSYRAYALNTLLTNALNRYHPFIFYVSAILTLTSLWGFFHITLHHKPFQISKILFYEMKTAWSIINLNLFSLFLGSWWALQEGTWGGWWNWDSSETFGLEVALISLIYVHSRIRLINSITLSLRYFSLVTLLILTYFFIQLNFELVSHNFGSKFFFFFNNNLFSLEMIIFLISSIYTCYKLNLRVWKVSISNERNYIQKPLNLALIIWLIIFYWIFWSFRPLLNYFSWNFFGVNVFNTENSLIYSHVLLLLSICIWAFHLTSFSTLFMILFVMFGPNWLWISLYTIKTLNIRYLIHWFLIAFLTINISILNTSISECFPHSIYLPLRSASETCWVTNSTITLDSLSIEISNTESSLLKHYSQNWNILTNSNVTSINFFSLNFDYYTLRNYYNLGTSYSTIYIEIDLPNLLSLVFIFMLIILLILNLLTQKR